MGLESLEIETLHELREFCQLLCGCDQADDAGVLMANFFRKNPQVAAFARDCFHYVFKTAVEERRCQIEALDQQSADLAPAEVKAASAHLRRRLNSELRKLCRITARLIDGIVPHCADPEDLSFFHILKADMRRYGIEYGHASEREVGRCLDQYARAHSIAVLNLDAHNCVRLRAAINLGVAQFKLSGVGEEARALVEKAFFSAIAAVSHASEAPDPELPGVLSWMARIVSTDLR